MVSTTRRPTQTTTSRLLSTSTSQHATGAGGAAPSRGQSKRTGSCSMPSGSRWSTLPLRSDRQSSARAEARMPSSIGSTSCARASLPTSLSRRCHLAKSSSRRRAGSSWRSDAATRRHGRAGRSRTMPPWPRRRALRSPTTRTSTTPASRRCGAPLAESRSSGSRSLGSPRTTRCRRCASRRARSSHCLLTAAAGRQADRPRARPDRGAIWALGEAGADPGEVASPHQRHPLLPPRRKFGSGQAEAHNVQCARRPERHLDRRPPLQRERVARQVPAIDPARAAPRHLFSSRPRP